MSKNKEKQPEDNLLELVKFYYKRYKDFEKAYENAIKNQEGLQDQLKPLVEKGSSDTEEFKNLALEYMKIQGTYTFEVGFASNKFLNAADTYLKVNEKDLPEDITKDYIMLKNEEYKPTLVVKDGQFVETSNKKVEMNNLQLEYIMKLLQEQLLNN
jgi:hypothetical protein